MIHLIVRFLLDQPNIFIDLILFNLIGLLSSVIALNAPLVTDRVVAVSIGSGLVIWSIGSFLSTWSSFYELKIPLWLPEFLYSLFYPLLFFGVIRTFTKRVKIAALELLDTAIIAIGFTSVLTAFLLKPAMIEFAGGALLYLSPYFIQSVTLCY